MVKKNSAAMVATIMAAGIITLIGAIESFSEDSITIYHKKKRSSKYRRSTIPMSKVVAYGAHARSGEKFVSYHGQVEVAEFVGDVDSTKNGFVVLSTDAGKVHVKVDNAEITSAEDFDADFDGKKKSKKDKAEKSDKKKKKKNKK